MTRIVVFMMISIFSSCSSAPKKSGEVALEQKAAIFERLVKEIERLDGDGLVPRANRPEPWKVTVERLRAELLKAESDFQIGRVFRRLNATYPNLHSRVFLDSQLRPSEGIFPAVTFKPEVLLRWGRVKNYRIVSIHPSAQSKDENGPRPGDELLAINGKPMAEWSKENFIFCKFPRRDQCEGEIWDQFRKELLSWHRLAPLEYQLKREEKIWTVEVPIVKESQQKASSSHGLEDICKKEAENYRGFRVAYRGSQICAFESSRKRGVTVLRIRSFQYETGGVEKEVSNFYQRYWKKRSYRTRNLVIDLIDNPGGESPVDWYRVLLKKPFQELFVRFKKYRELEELSFLKAALAGEPEKKLTFENFKRWGDWDVLGYGGFFPPMPQFCAQKGKDCRDGNFRPFPHGFKGKVTVMVNQWCISSCAGFVWQVRQKFGKRAKFIGIPDSGDTTYARAFIDVVSDPKRGFQVAIRPRPVNASDSPSSSSGILLRKVVSVTRSTNRKGRMFSGIPQEVDYWVPKYWDQNFDEWRKLVFAKALAL